MLTLEPKIGILWAIQIQVLYCVVQQALDEWVTRGQEVERRDERLFGT